MMNDISQGLVLDNATTYYEGQPFQYSLNVAPGECLGVVGPSGGGKSTLLDIIAGFAPLSEGHVQVNGQNIGQQSVEERPVTLMFQSHNLFPHMSVVDNVLLGIDPRLKRRRDDRDRVEQVLGKVGLATYGTRLPGQLSGGQRQRVALARALLRERPVLMLDEPLAALGPAHRQEMLALLGELTHQHQLSVLLVSHQPNEIEPLCSRSIFIANGRVAWECATKDFQQADMPEQVAAYLGQRPFLRQASPLNRNV